MKIAITGGTTGIGKATKELLESQGHEVVDFSRTTRYDICDVESRKQIVRNSLDCDVFINNAFSFKNMFAQIEMLYDIYNAWCAHDRLIVNVGSNSSDGIKTFIHKYAVAKAALDKASEQLTGIDKCRVSNVRFGLVNTDMSKTFSGTKMTAKEAAVHIVNVVNIPKNQLVKAVTIEPR